MEFEELVYTISVQETPADDSDVPTTPSPPGEATVSTTCTVDGATSQDLRYTVLEGAIGTIEETTGEFSLVTESFDYEMQSAYAVRLLCYLSSDPSSNATATLTVTVTPINEYLPVISSSGSSTTTIAETAPPGTTIAATSIGSLLSYTASDRDEGPDGVITYSLVDNLHDDLFELDRESGTLLLKTSPDVDSLDTLVGQFQVGIVACNEHISTALCNSIALTVYVTAANDIAPQFEPSLYPISLLEAAPIGSTVVETHCVDRDNGPGGTFTVVFHEQTSEIVLDTFLLSPSGAVVLQSMLDYELGPVNYQFQLVCSDGEFQDVAQVLLAVLPTNDNVPSFLQDRYEFTVDRSSPAGHTVGQVRAEDGDIDTGSNVTYSVDDDSYFNIDSLNGEIKIRDHIPSSAGSRFELQVFATDGDFSTNTSVEVSVRGAVSVPEFIGIVVGVLIFILLVVAVLFLIGLASFLYIRATRRRYISS